MVDYSERRSAPKVRLTVQNITLCVCIQHTDGIEMIRPQTCPICERELPVNAESSENTFPFCSKRCQQVDLFRWSEAKYSIIEPFDQEIEGDGFGEA